MMRKNSWLIFLLVSSSTFGQIPDFNPNLDLSESILFEKFGDSYDAFISFSEFHSFSKFDYHHLLAQKEDSWMLITWKRKNSNKGKAKRGNIKKEVIPDSTVISFISFLNELDFFNLSIDSLVLNKKPLIGGGELARKLGGFQRVAINDGTNFSFEFYHNDELFRYKVSNLEALQRFVFTLDREKYLLASDRFKEIIERNKR